MLPGPPLGIDQEQNPPEKSLRKAAVFRHHAGIPRLVKDAEMEPGNRRQGKYRVEMTPHKHIFPERFCGSHQAHAADIALTEDVHHGGNGGQLANPKADVGGEFQRRTFQQLIGASVPTVMTSISE